MLLIIYLRYISDDKYANLLKEIAQRLDEKQINIALNYCMDKLNDKNEHQNIRIKCIQLPIRINKYSSKDKSLVKLLELISTKLNDKQLYVLNSNNHIWKTENNIDIELLAFGLMIFIPRIQLSCDDNTNFDALNELIRYFDKQAIEWKYPTYQLKWNNTHFIVNVLCEFLCTEDNKIISSISLLFPLSASFIVQCLSMEKLKTGTNKLVLIKGD
ncbi:hypothetical protein RFI_32814 [Reticulomyxa filosa]|uniref:Uncharacterized protein n=1 Tax=Reticulomyxa filosa TaxID=46433 RepID=X6LTX9_RETFI|nr:hypothetical protein RFI_32814 [Reticulomyxa filosa]|eukprot:ETO04582.1 hypothetical protein RFI_32814 [Reticulomyxa filosa]